MREGERFRCPDPECECELEVVKEPRHREERDHAPRCCCGKDMQKI